MCGTKFPQGGENLGLDCVFSGEGVGDEPGDIGECRVMALGGGEEFAVDIDGEDGTLMCGLGEEAGKVADAGADFKDDIVGLHVAGRDDGPEDVLVHHEILAELMPRPESGGGENGGDFDAVHGFLLLSGRGRAQTGRRAV